MDNTVSIISAAVTDRGLSEKRPQNEDSYLEMRQSGIFAVADGVGGAQAGEVASQMAMEILAEAFTNVPEATDAETVMRTAIERANTAIFQMAHQLPQLSSMATTIVALHVAGNIATIGHVGDSRLYRVDRDGNIVRETDDHSVVAEEVRAGRMTEEQAEAHPSRNIINRALGADMLVEPDLKTIMVEPGTAFLLCSDGVTRHVDDQEIKGVLTFGGTPDDVCEYLKGLCYERGAEDNLTAVVVKIASTNGVARDTGELELEESTVATARPALGSTALHDSADLLELETQDLSKHVVDEPAVEDETADTVSFTLEEAMPEATPMPEPAVAAAAPATPAPQADQPPFSMFGSTAAADEKVVEKSDSLGRFAIYAGILVLGGLLGFFAFYFAGARSEPPPAPAASPITEMSSPNIPMTTFEKNRRNVDSDPGGYIAKAPIDPQDSEDNYLLGRAYLLTGDYAKARESFLAARELLSRADPSNAKVLASDIATGLAVTNNTTIQGILKNEVEAVTKAATNTETNANR
jgi:protein phosphatase